MLTEYAASLAKDFDKNALKQIKEACEFRANLCRDEYVRRSNREDWDLSDLSDLSADRMAYERIAMAVDELLNA